MHPQLMPVPFYGDTVMLVGQDNEPFVAMRPVVTNMGLDWASQYTKLNSASERWGVVIITTPSLGGAQEAVCLPLRKLASWLMTLNPKKVKPELRDKIIRYQEECDDALWAYWTKGGASRPGANTVNQQIAMSRHRVALLEKLLKTRDNTVRAALHEQLTLVSQQLGLSVPALETIGKAAPKPDDYLAPLWSALDDLDVKGVEYNHSKTPDTLLALHWGLLQEQLDLHCPALKLTFDLRRRAQQSIEPQYLGYKNVASRIKNKPVKCYIFKPLGKFNV